MKFEGVVIPSGNATAVEVPAAIMQALSQDARPLVRITINGYLWRSRVARMRGLCLVGISAAHRAASAIALGDTVTVELELDTEPRDVAEPADLAAALDRSPDARVAFDRLAFGLKCKHVRDIAEAKSSEVRQRRIAKLVGSMANTAQSTTLKAAAARKPPTQA